ncbi:MAG: hypothetical protein IKC08_06700 [Lentisphaeria bacterium]|nr:hypothetical protein [Lentisphaeria bacterium]
MSRKITKFLIIFCSHPVKIEGHPPSPIGIKEGLAMTLPGIYAAQSAKEGGALKKIIYPRDKE